MTDTVGGCTYGESQQYATNGKVSIGSITAVDACLQECSKRTDCKAIQLLAAGGTCELLIGETYKNGIINNNQYKFYTKGSCGK